MNEKKRRQNEREYDSWIEMDDGSRIYSFEDGKRNM